MQYLPYSLASFVTSLIEGLIRVPRILIYSFICESRKDYVLLPDQALPERLNASISSTSITSLLKAYPLINPLFLAFVIAWCMFFTKSEQRFGKSCFSSVWLLDFPGITLLRMLLKTPFCSFLFVCGYWLFPSCFESSKHSPRLSRATWIITFLFSCSTYPSIMNFALSRQVSRNRGRIHVHFLGDT